jgi:hypothetical protein
MTKLTDAGVLENEYFNNVKTVESLRERNQNIIVSLVKLYHGISVGDVVIHRGSEYKITRLGIHDWSIYDRDHKPWVYATPKNKNGEWSKADYCMYSEWGRVL